MLSTGGAQLRHVQIVVITAQQAAACGHMNSKLESAVPCISVADTSNFD